MEVCGTPRLQVKRARWAKRKAERIAALPVEQWPGVTQDVLCELLCILAKVARIDSYPYQTRRIQ